MLSPKDFFELEDNPCAALFDGLEFVWEAVGRIRDFVPGILESNAAPLRKDGSLLTRTLVLHEGRVLESGFRLEPGDASKGRFIVCEDGKVLEGASVVYAGAVLMDDAIHIGRGTVVEPGALIKGPTVILGNTEVRQGAYIRGDVLVGRGCVVGHATEVKSSVLLGGSKAGHFAYIGDSLLGRCNLGAGTKLANMKIDHTPVALYVEGKKIDTGLRKFGAVVGDGAETGCNSVTAPGTLLGRNVLVYPNASARGYYPPGTILKLKQDHILKKKAG